MFTVVEQLFMIQETIFKMLFYMSEDNIFAYIQRCHSQYWHDSLCILFGTYFVEKIIFITAIAVIYPRFIRFCDWNFKIMHISLGVHIGRMLI